MPKQFNIEQQYQGYLQMVRLDESLMSEEQKIETRRAYYAAVGQFWVFLVEEFANMTDDQADVALDNVRQQTLEFWEKAAKDIEG